MTQADHLKQLTDIRDIMEKSSRFISLSGLSGVFAGFFAIIGALFFYIYCLQKYDFNIIHSEHTHEWILKTDIIWVGILIAILVLVLSIGVGIFFTTRKAKRKGLQIWYPTTWRLIFNLAIPLATGGIVCLFMLHYGLAAFIGPFTLIFYGFGLLNCSKYTLDEVRYLGVSEIILGLVALYFIGYGLIFWVIGFGFLHIAYGWYMYRIHE